MRVVPLLALSLLLPAVAQAEPLRVTRVGGGEMTVEIERGSDRKASAAVVLQDACPADAKGLPFALPPAVVRLEPPACENGLPPSVRERVLDVLTLAAHLREEAPWWNGRLYLVGSGEGAEVAAAAAALAPGVDGVVLVNGAPPPELVVGLKAPVLVYRAEHAPDLAGMGVLKGAATRRSELTFYEIEGLDAELKDASGAFAGEPVLAQVRRWLARRDLGDAGETRTAEKPKETQPAAKPKAAPVRRAAAASAPDSRPTTGAPPRRAMAASFRPVPAAPARSVGAASLRLRESLPATPSPRPGTRQPAPRSSAGTAPRSSDRRP
jgi:pimeloyl-ACP methyl ester carboxylesterase